MEKIRAAGANVIPVSLPNTRYALSAYYVISSAEVSSNMARYSGVHYGQQTVWPVSHSGDAELCLQEREKLCCLAQTSEILHQSMRRLDLNDLAMKCKSESFWERMP